VLAADVCVCVCGHLYGYYYVKTGRHLYAQTKCIMGGVYIINVICISRGIYIYIVIFRLAGIYLVVKRAFREGFMNTVLHADIDVSLWIAIYAERNANL
jgi:hypothetical protein